MTRTFVMVVVSALLFAGAQGLRAQPKGRRTTVTGEVVDLLCYLEGGDLHRIGEIALTRAVSENSRGDSLETVEGR